MTDDDLVELPSTNPAPTSALAFWEDDGSSQWPLHLHACASVDGFLSQDFDGRVKGPHPQQRQLVLTLPTAEYDLARGIQWWEPGNPVLVKLLTALLPPSTLTPLTRFPRHCR